MIKVERPPGGDEFRVAHGGRGGSSFEVYNRDQRSALSTCRRATTGKCSTGSSATRDVVVDNYRGGVAARLGIDHDSWPRSTRAS